MTTTMMKSILYPVLVVFYSHHKINPNIPQENAVSALGFKTRDFRLMTSSEMPIVCMYTSVSSRSRSCLT